MSEKRANPLGGDCGYCGQPVDEPNPDCVGTYHPCPTCMRDLGDPAPECTDPAHRGVKPAQSHPTPHLPENDVQVDFGTPAPGSSNPMPAEVTRAYEERILSAAEAPGLPRDPATPPSTEEDAERLRAYCEIVAGNPWLCDECGPVPSSEVEVIHGDYVYRHVHPDHAEGEEPACRRYPSEAEHARTTLRLLSTLKEGTEALEEIARIADKGMGLVYEEIADRARAALPTEGGE